MQVYAVPPASLSWRGKLHYRLFCLVHLLYHSIQCSDQPFHQSFCLRASFCLQLYVRPLACVILAHNACVLRIMLMGPGCCRLVM